MYPEVELINNPYTQRLRVLINGKAASEYTGMERFIGEPFVYWCDKIFEALYEECNRQPFSLCFSSREEERAVMEKLSEDCKYCVQYSGIPLVRDTPLLERMKSLNKLVRGFRSSDYHTFQHTAMFVLPPSLYSLERDLLDMEVKNSFCRVTPEVLRLDDFARYTPRADSIFFIGDAAAVERFWRTNSEKADFIIRLTDIPSHSFSEKRGRSYVYDSGSDAVFETVFECLLLGALMQMFVGCVNSLSPDVRRENARFLDQIQSVDQGIVPQPEATTIEAGHSSRIKFNSDINGGTIDLNSLRFTYNPENIIRCNGLLVEGLAPGHAALLVYREGEHIPSARVDYSVVLRNRITKLALSETSLLMGVGDIVTLESTYLPVNADNVSAIQFVSDHPEIASVSGVGRVRAVARGTCTIQCFAERVSARCQCTVKPLLEEICPEVEHIDMIYGETSELKLTLFPSDCVDSELMLSSMDMSIVNVVGCMLTAVGLGSTRVIIQNCRETVRAEISVCVMTEKEYRKMQKMKDSPPKKGGWLSALFGR